MDKKDIKKIIQKEIVPYLVGLRNEIADKPKDFLGENEIKGVIFRGEPGKDGETPQPDVHYPSEKTVFQFIKDNLPKRGREYWTEKDIKDTVEQVLSLMPSKDELRGKDGNNAEVDYSLVKELTTPLISAKYKELKAYVDDMTDRLLKAVNDTKKPELTAEAIRTKLESLKGNARLDAKAIKGLEKYMSTFIATSGGGGGGASSGSGTETDTLSTVTARGASTSTLSTFSGGLNTTAITANTSAGLLLESNAGTDVALLGAGGGSGATFYGGVNVAGQFAVNTDALYVDQTNKRVGINTTTLESYPLRIVASGTPGMKMTRVSPFTSSEFRVDLSGSGAEVVATGSGGTCVFRGFVSGATQAYVSAGHLAVGATAASARIHSTWTGGDQFRSSYDASNYWTLRNNNTGTTTYDARGGSPRHRFDIAGSETLTLAASSAVFTGTSPRLDINDLGGYNIFIQAGYGATSVSGMYESGTSSAIATYDFASGRYDYAGGNLYYDAGASTLYSSQAFDAPSVTTASLTSNGYFQVNGATSQFNGTVEMTATVTGLGPPATILTSYQVYVDTATGIMYLN